MNLTKMECPNCHGTLTIPDGMKEGFVTCAYCKTKVYIEPNKPNITQNIHIDNVNMGQRSAPVRQDLGAIQALAVIGGIVFIFLMLILSNIARTSHPSHTSASRTTVKFRTVPEDETVKSFVEKAFGKQLKDITTEDYHSIAALSIQIVNSSDADKSEQWQFNYAKSVNEDGTAKDPETIYLPATDSLDEADMQVFTGLTTLSLGYQVHFNYDADSDAKTLKNLTDLRYFSGQNEDFQTVSKLFRES